MEAIKPSTEKAKQVYLFHVMMCEYVACKAGVDLSGLAMNEAKILQHYTKEDVKNKQVYFERLADLFGGQITEKEEFTTMKAFLSAIEEDSEKSNIKVLETLSKLFGWICSGFELVKAFQPNLGSGAETPTN